MADGRLQLRVLFCSRFADAYGLVTLATLLGTYVTDPEAEGWSWGCSRRG